ncbi:hypothetical protein KY305_19335 [Bacillus sp. YC2]|uniref:hypothetical protein n=1 Tax=Bacillus sp. YC2 TaxID=2861287 RepID=UPI001CA61F87|nr:hypothetical protein [Bacillus sp. YC2]MBY8914873.1 hypothetical protein [Bacillus sp. YC2]
MSASNQRKKHQAGAMLVFAFVLFVLLFSEQGSKPLAEGGPKNWHTVVDQASVSIYGHQLFEKERLEKTHGRQQSETILALVKLANEEHNIL